MSALYNDGDIPYGSDVLTLRATTSATTGTSYIADTISYSRVSKRIERTNQLDEPSGQMGIPGFNQMTCTLQRATTSTPQPTQGAVASFTPPGAGAAVWFILDTCETPQPKDQAHSYSCTFYQKVN